MANLPLEPDDSKRGSMPATPRWVKVSGVIALVLAVLLVVMLLSGHGPRQHLRSGLGGDMPLLVVTGQGVQKS